MKNYVTTTSVVESGWISNGPTFKCKYCNYSVGTKRDSCPKCGKDMRKKIKMSYRPNTAI